VDSGVNTPVIDANIPAITKTDDDYQMQVLGSVASINPGTSNGATNEFGNGDDQIVTGSGRDMIFGGGGNDTINAYGSGGAAASADGNNIVFGDHGLVDYPAESALVPLAANPWHVRERHPTASGRCSPRLGGNDSIRPADATTSCSLRQRHDRRRPGFNLAMGDSGKLTPTTAKTVRANISRGPRLHHLQDRNDDRRDFSEAASTRSSAATRTISSAARAPT
jgi:Ca2+-binding RTX toxin-like protein